MKNRMVREMFHVLGKDRTLNPGEITFGVRAPLPRFEATNALCPFCSSPLERALNASRVKIHRVGKVLGPERDGEIPFLASVFPWKTHEFLGCRECKIGFSTLKYAGEDDPTP